MPGNSLKLGKDAATDLADLCLRHTRELNDMLRDVERRGNEDDFSMTKQIVGKLMGEMYVAALYPIFEEYPDLKPEGFP